MQHLSLFHAFSAKLVFFAFSFIFTQRRSPAHLTPHGLKVTRWLSGPKPFHATFHVFREFSQLDQLPVHVETFSIKIPSQIVATSAQQHQIFVINKSDAETELFSGDIAQESATCDKKKNFVKKKIEATELLVM